MLSRILIAITLVGASVEPSWAECAWVLWTEIVMDNSQNFRATSGWPYKESCEAQRAQIAATAKVPMQDGIAPSHSKAAAP